jgi:hypothetical protein
MSAVGERLSFNARAHAALANPMLKVAIDRTTDIEGMLVRGAHGPGQLHVVLVGDAAAKPEFADPPGRPTMSERAVGTDAKQSSSH